jgi:hypothetical protein
MLWSFHRYHYGSVGALCQTSVLPEESGVPHQHTRRRHSQHSRRLYAIPAMFVYVCVFGRA